MSSSTKDIKIAPGAIVCLESKLKGNVTVGSMTIIHPKATLIAEAGPIIVGENNIIEEQASIIHRVKDGAQTDAPVPLTIGVNNVFEVGCEIHAKAIGDHNVFEPKSYVGPDVEIGNGCIIGAGCHVTMSEKLPDQTVVTGKHCVQSIALDKPPDPDDLTRQKDELTVMSEIFTEEEFFICPTGGDAVAAIFHANIVLPSNFVLKLTNDLAKTDFPITHLPPIRLEVFLIHDYPSKNPPNYNLSCCWLPKSKLDHLILELDRLWEENHCEILFTWCSFLKDQSLESLNITDKYDLSEKYVVGTGQEQKECTTHKWSTNAVEKGAHKDLTISYSGSRNADTSRKYSNNNKYHYANRTKRFTSKKNIGNKNDFLSSKPEEKLVRESKQQLAAYQKSVLKDLYYHLIEFNASKLKLEFLKSTQLCNVCFSPVLGESCKQLSCGHITCTGCLTRMCEVHIKHGTMESIVCAEENCGLEIPANLIKELVSKELFDHFDLLMLNRTLDKMTNMTYCPLVHCQYPVSTQGDESLGLCPSCHHAFCIFCKRAYHGVEGCKFKSEEKRELIESYQNGDHQKKLELEKRYGKKQLTELLNAVQSELWMSENSKQCPCCHINIEKNHGCNKMVCRKCNTHFCWMCLTRLSSLNPYLHFQDPRSRCYNLLFEGTFVENLDDDETEEEDDDE